MPSTLWMRAETKPDEARTPLTPSTATALIEQGFKLVVEQSTSSAFAAEEFAAAGCEIANPGDWQQAPKDTFVLGLKELPENIPALEHRHIYFAHAYKEQAGWAQLLHRFELGGGTLLDLEYLVDDTGRRLAAFGFWAGFMGAALATLTWCGQQDNRHPPLGALQPWADQDALLKELAGNLALIAETSPPRMIVIGAGGRVGRGALELCQRLNLPHTPWDLPETARGGPFPEILAHDIFLNAVLVDRPLPPFITLDMLEGQGRAGSLSVIADVSCDPYGDYNPVPLYNACSTLAQPLIPVAGGIDLIAIDHLPSLLPRESSEDFANQLLPLLLQLGGSEDAPWQRAENLFHEKLQLAKGVM